MRVPSGRKVSTLPAVLLVFCLRGMAFFAVAFLLFRAADVPEELNLDIANYRADYEGDYARYEWGYEALVAVMHQQLDLPFGAFWYILIGVQILIFLYAYETYTSGGAVIGFPLLLSLAVSTIGMQIRFGLSCALLVLALSCFYRSHRLRGILVAAIACSIHNAAYLITLLYAAVCFQFYFKRNWYIRLHLSFAVIVLAILALAANIEFLLMNGRYASYFGTEFFEAKSTSSVIYTIVILTWLGFLVTYKYLHPNPIILLHVALLAGALVLSTYAVLGGRLLVMSFFLEPITIMVFFRPKLSPLRLLLGLPLIALSWCKVLLLK